MDSNERELLIKQLRYRSWHRGCKETDILLGKFSDQHIDRFNEVQLMQLKAICEVDDWDLYAWVTGSLPIPDEYNTEVMQMILKFDCS